MEQRIVAMSGGLTPSRILHYFIKNTFFQMTHEKHPHTFIIIGRVGPTGKTWLTTNLRKHGFMAFELSESIFDLVEYCDEKNHVIEDRVNNNIIIVLNEPLVKGE